MQFHPRHPHHRSSQPGDPVGEPATGEAVALVLREARRLQRAAVSGALAASLPVLRRLLATGAIAGTTLPEAFRRRATLQRKHVLRALAVEAGFRSWEEYRPSLAHTPRADLAHIAAAVHRDPGRLKLWFRNLAEADAFALEHGGKAVPMGRQAVVLPAHPQAVEGGLA